MNKHKFEALILLFILTLIWGSSFILMKKGMLTYSPSQVASMRVFFAGLTFVPYFLISLKKIPWEKFGYILLFGLLELGVPPFLYTFAQTHIDSSSAGILNSLVPIFTIITGVFMFKLRYHIITTLGVLIGLVGALMITYVKHGNGAPLLDFSNSWGLLIVLATFFYGISGNLIMEKLHDVPAAIVTGVAFVTLSVPAGIYLFSTGFLSVPLNSHQSLQSLGSVILLAVFGSSLAMVIFSKLIKLSGALFASFVTWLIPFVSLMWGWLDGESISYLHFISMAVIFLGIYVSGLKEKGLNAKT